MLQRLVDIKTDATAAFEKDSKRLLVRLDADLLTLALADKQTGAWEAAELLKAEMGDRSGEDFMSQLKQSSMLASYKGLDTQVLIATETAMAIPTALSESSPLFFETQFGETDQKILTDTVAEDILFAFAPQAWQQAFVTQFFPDATLYNTLALLTRQALEQTKNEGTCLYLHIGKTYAEIALIQQGQLALARHLPYPTPTDLLYHLLNIARQLGLQPASLSLQLQGFVTEEDEVYQVLQKHFAPVGFAGDVTPIRHKAFWKVPPHFFTGLMLSV